MTLKILPRVDWTSGVVVERGTLDATATPAADRQITLVAEHAPIRTIYGEDRVGAQVANQYTKAGYWVFQCIWCEGEIDSINDLRLNDEALPSRAIATHYTGTAGQGVDATLVWANPEYEDALPGIAYTVIKVPVDLLDGQPSITATVKGLKLYDPRTGLTAWSDNPALALRDFLIRAGGYTTDESSVEALADICDALVSGSKRRTIGLTLDTVQEVGRWIDTLRTYASSWLTMGGGQVKMVPDRPRATDGTISHAAGQIKSLALKKRGVRQVPTAIRVRYTNTTAIPWRDDWVEADSGETPRRESEVPLPGIHDASQAYREAIERLNKLRLGDLSAEIEVFDEGLEIEVGDVREITHPFGLDAKPMRVLAVSGDYGRYRVSLAEYDPAMYSDAVTSTPTYPDTSLPSYTSPEQVTGLSLIEENFVTRNGTTQTRFRAIWTAPDAPWPLEYRVVFSALGVPDVEQRVRATEAVSDQVVEGLLYQAQVFTLNSLFSSVAVVATATAVGKGLLPGNITAASAFEVGGEVRVTIGAAIDKDLKFYELRYDDGSKANGVGGETWATIWAAATFVDATPAASGVGGFIATKSIPVGDVRLLICALDSVDQYSPVPFAIPVTVTLDVNSFLVGNHSYTSPGPTGMAEYSLPGDPKRYFATEDGATAASKFTGLASGYGNIAATYHASMASQFLTEAHDFEMMLAGSWQGEIASEALSGTKADVISLSEAGSSYVDQASLSAKANARFGKVKSSASGTSTLKVTLPDVTLRVDAVPRTQDGEVTTNATGATTITLTEPCAKFKSIGVTPQGTTACAWTVDNVITGATPSFDIYTFNPTTGAQIARAVRWNAETV